MKWKQKCVEMLPRSPDLRQAKIWRDGCSNFGGLLGAEILVAC